MNRNQWLFEAPSILTASHPSNSYGNPEYYIPQIEAEWEVQAIPEVHLPIVGRTVSRNQTAGRAFPLNEPNQPTRDGSTSTQQRNQLTQIINWLRVEVSQRYAPVPSQHKTFCNIYAYDYCYLARTYLPRVWWTRSALTKLAAGQSVPVKYGSTVGELNANSLHKWFEEFGQQFGWRRTSDLTELQAAANDGQVCMITAEKKDLRRSGHICAVVPETSEYRAKRGGAQVLVPLQSQAGTHNFRYCEECRSRSCTRECKKWWTDASFRKFGFWIHP